MIELGIVVGSFEAVALFLFAPRMEGVRPTSSSFIQQAAFK